MATTEGKRAQAITTFLEENASQSDAVKQAGIAAIGRASQATTDDLWKRLISGLVVIMVIALAGMLAIMVAKGATHEAALTVFTTTLAGLLGLFAPSPTRGNGGAGDGSGPGGTGGTGNTGGAGAA